MYGTKFFFLMLLMTAIVSPASAMNITLTPEDPFVGDNITLKGDTAPNQRSLISIALEKKFNLSGRGGHLYYQLPEIDIPFGENQLKIIGYNVSYLTVGVGFPAIFKKSAAGYHGYADLSWSNVPSGKYLITISANALYQDMKEITLYFTVDSYIKSDDKGNLNYTYSTSGLPAGDYGVFVRGRGYPITLHERPVPIISSSKTTPTVIQTVPVVTSTPLPTQITANITTVAKTTSVPERIVVITSTPLVSSTYSKPTPGFEIALFSAITILYIIKRRL